MENLTIVLPERVTRQDIFNLVAVTNNYKLIIKTEEKVRTIYLEEEITEEILNSGLIVETEKRAPVGEETEEKVIRIVTEEIMVTEIDNPETLEMFAKRIIKEKLLIMINDARKKTTEKLVQERINEVTEEIQGADIEGGDIL